MINAPQVRVSARAFITLPNQKSIVFVYKDHKPKNNNIFNYDMPGGGLEPEESPLNCALRELKEETNLDGYSNGLICEYDNTLTYFDNFESVEKTVRRVGWVFDIMVRTMKGFKLEPDANLETFLIVDSGTAKQLLSRNYPQILG